MARIPILEPFVGGAKSPDVILRQTHMRLVVGHPPVPGTSSDEIIVTVLSPDEAVFGKGVLLPSRRFDISRKGTRAQPLAKMAKCSHSSLRLRIIRK